MIVSLLTLCSAASVMATPSLSYTTQDLGSGIWSYNYTITNDLVGQAIDTFSIDFANGLYSGLQIDASPAGWGTSYVVDPSFTSTGSNPGYLFGFADPAFEIASGSSLNGFVVSFTWNLVDPPLGSIDGILANGDQAFNFTTIPVDAPAPVPEPTTVFLMGLGLAGLAGFRKFTRR
jgi:hypothetical protein